MVSSGHLNLARVVIVSHLPDSVFWEVAGPAGPAGIVLGSHQLVAVTFKVSLVECLSEEVSVVVFGRRLLQVDFTRVAFISDVGLVHPIVLGLGI